MALIYQHPAGQKATVGGTATFSVAALAAAGSDNFNRADGVLVAPWVVTPTVANIGTIVSNAIQQQVGGSDSSAYNTQVAYGSDQYSEVSILASTAAGTVFPTVRHAVGAFTFYKVQRQTAGAIGTPANLLIASYVGGAYTQLGITPNVVINAGDKLGISAVGNVITAWLNRIPLFSVVDGNISGGNPGFYMFGATAGTDARADNFVALDSVQSTPTYQWYKNGVSIPGATSSSYTTPALQGVNNLDRYSCAVTDSEGTTTSNAGLLQIVGIPVGGNGGDNDSAWTRNIHGRLLRTDSYALTRKRFGSLEDVEQAGKTIFTDWLFGIEIIGDGATGEGETAVGTGTSGGAGTVTGTAATAQGESASGAGLETISGAATTGEAQTAVASGSEAISGTATTAEGETAAAIGLETISGTATTRQAETAVGTGAETIPGTATTAQGETAGGAGLETITGSATTAEAETIAGTGTSQPPVTGTATTAQGETTVGVGASGIGGTATTGQGETASGTGLETISGGATTAQGESANATGLAGIVGTGATAEGQTAVGTGSEKISGTATTAQGESAAATGGETISGGATTAQGESATGAGTVTAGSVTGTGTTAQGSESIAAIGAIGPAGVASTGQGETISAIGVVGSSVTQLQRILVAALNPIFAGQVFAQVAPDDLPVPYAVYAIAQILPTNTCADGIPIERTQFAVHVYAATFAQARALGAQVRAALTGLAPPSQGIFVAQTGRYIADVKLHVVEQNFAMWRVRA